MSVGGREQAEGWREGGREGGGRREEGGREQGDGGRGREQGDGGRERARAEREEAMMLGRHRASVEDGMVDGECG